MQVEYLVSVFLKSIIEWYSNCLKINSEYAESDTRSILRSIVSLIIPIEPLKGTRLVSDVAMRRGVLFSKFIVSINNQQQINKKFDRFLINIPYEFDTCSKTVADFHQQVKIVVELHNCLKAIYQGNLRRKTSNPIGPRQRSQSNFLHSSYS